MASSSVAAMSRLVPFSSSARTRDACWQAVCYGEGSRGRTTRDRDRDVVVLTRLTYREAAATGHFSHADARRDADGDVLNSTVGRVDGFTQFVFKRLHARRAARVDRDRTRGGIELDVSWPRGAGRVLFDRGIATAAQGRRNTRNGVVRNDVGFHGATGNTTMPISARSSRRAISCSAVVASCR